MSRTGYWLTYDLGIDGDYDGLYAWLDSVQAKECGDSACYFEYEVRGAEPTKAILASIKKSATLRAKDRVYLIWPKPAGSGYKGRFFAGKRRRAPWAGYAVESSDEDENAGD